MNLKEYVKISQANKDRRIEVIHQLKTGRLEGEGRETSAEGGAGWPGRPTVLS